MTGHAPSITAMHCTLETLTPLHVGSGEVYVKGLEYFERKGPQNVVDLTVVPRNWLAAIEKNLSANEINGLANALEKGDALGWLEKNKRLASLRKHTLPLNAKENPPREIREQITNGLGLPLVPGSSLKGALRTAIIKELLIQDSSLQDALHKEKVRLLREHKVKPEHADKLFLKTALGSDPKYDLMRTMRVGDLSYQQSDLALFKVMTLSLGANDSFSPKPFLNVVEGIRPDRTATGLISFDLRLQEYAEGRGKALFNFRTRLDSTWLLQALRNLSKNLLQEELAFLEGKKGMHIEGLRAGLRRLDGVSKNLGQNEAIFNLGWGIGWRGMTGSLIDNKDLDKDQSALRKSLNLAANYDKKRQQFKYLHMPFPKSRRVALQGDAPVTMGWVKIRMEPIEALRELQRLERERNEAELSLQALKRKEQELIDALPPEERLLRELEEGKMDNTAIGTRWNDLMALQGEQLQRAAKALKTFWQKNKDWDVKPRKKKQYDKVQQVKKILGEA